MDDKELYLQKIQAQLGEWKADLDKMKAKALGKSADVQLEMNKNIRILESKIDEEKAKISELAKNGGEAWESIKDGVESSWNLLSSSVRDAVSKLKR